MSEDSLMRRPTMKDVAAAAGVSLKTVSRFVNGETNIDPVLSQRIEAAIGSLGYRRNLSAASIRPGWTSRTIGLVTSDLANPYYATLARAVERVAGAAGFMVMTSSSEEDGARHDRIVDRMLDQRLDGLVIVPPRTAGRPWQDIPGSLPPIVFVDRPGGLKGAPTVLADNVGGARSAVKALASDGATRIAFVGDSLTLYTMGQRHRGYVEALEESGLPVAPELTLDAVHRSSQAIRIVADLVTSGAADAIFAANNRAALGALAAFRLTGRRLPIIGFDDFEAADIMVPGFSVVDQDVSQMGELAASMLFSMLDGHVVESTDRMLATSLVLRGSERSVLDSSDALS